MAKAKVKGHTRRVKGKNVKVKPSTRKKKDSKSLVKLVRHFGGTKHPSKMTPNDWLMLLPKG